MRTVSNMMSRAEFDALMAEYERQEAEYLDGLRNRMDQRAALWESLFAEQREQSARQAALTDQQVARTARAIALLDGKLEALNLAVGGVAGALTDHIRNPDGHQG